MMNKTIFVLLILAFVVGIGIPDYFDNAPVDGNHYIYVDDDVVIDYKSLNLIVGDSLYYCLYKGKVIDSYIYYDSQTKEYFNVRRFYNNK